MLYVMDISLAYLTTINLKLPFKISKIAYIKVRLSLYFTLSTTPLRRIGGVEVYLHAFLTLAIDGGEWSASPPGKEPLVPIA
jgi:hypothetical protein